MKRFLMATAALSALAVVGQAGMAAGFVGTLEGGYSYAKTEGESANAYNGSAAALASFGSINVQLNAGIDRVAAFGDHGTGWDGVLTGFWRDAKGIAGVSLSYGAPQWADVSHVEGAGAFGEWYFWPELTLRAKGGWTQMLAYGEKHAGGFAGVGAEYYFIPDLGFNAQGEYTSIKGANIRSATFGAEYLFSRELPLSMIVSYDYQKLSLFSNSAYMVRLKYRFGASGALVELDRSGPSAWTAASPLLSNQATFLPAMR